MVAKNPKDIKKKTPVKKTTTSTRGAKENKKTVSSGEVQLFKQPDDSTVVRITQADGTVVEYDSNLLSAQQKSVPGMLREIMQLEDPKTKQRNIMAILLRATEDAKHGNPQARDFIVDRLEGKAVIRQTVQNLDVLNRIVEILSRLISDPVLMTQIIFEFRKLSIQQEDSLMG